MHAEARSTLCVQPFAVQTACMLCVISLSSFLPLADVQSGWRFCLWTLGNSACSCAGSICAMGPALTPAMQSAVRGSVMCGADRHTPGSSVRHWGRVLCRVLKVGPLGGAWCNSGTCSHCLCSCFGANKDKVTGRGCSNSHWWFGKGAPGRPV